MAATGLTSVSPVQGSTGLAAGAQPKRKSTLVAPGIGVGTAAPATAGALHGVVLSVASAGTWVDDVGGDGSGQRPRLVAEPARKGGLEVEAAQRPGAGAGAVNASGSVTVALMVTSLPTGAEAGLGAARLRAASVRVTTLEPGVS